MASRQYYRKAFEALETEGKRVAFCLHIVMTEWLYDGREKDRLPEDYITSLSANLQGALEDAGRSDLWHRFDWAIDRWLQNKKKG
jgi:hypothetical protein